MIQYLILILAIPLGILLAKITSDEKNIFTKTQYFPTIKKILLILIAIFLIIPTTIYSIPSTKMQIVLTLTFILITTHTWQKTN